MLAAGSSPNIVSLILGDPDNPEKLIFFEDVVPAGGSVRLGALSLVGGTKLFSNSHWFHRVKTDIPVINLYCLLKEDGKKKMYQSCFKRENTPSKFKMKYKRTAKRIKTR